jgi:hypothetical protein
MEFSSEDTVEFLDLFENEPLFWNPKRPLLLKVSVHHLLLRFLSFFVHQIPTAHHHISSTDSNLILQFTIHFYSITENQGIVLVTDDSEYMQLFTNIPEH